MKRLATIIIAFMCYSFCQAQTAFDKVFEGCKLAVSSLSNGTGSQGGMREAAQKLKEAKWVTFQLKEAEGEGSIGKHMMFTEKYFTDLANNHKVKGKAKEYAEERAGDGVRLCTKVKKKGKTVKYSFNYQGGRTLKVGVVAEVDGLVNLKVRAKKKGSAAAAIERKENSNEYKGAAYRNISVALPDGQYLVTLEITNKYTKDRSVAIIAN